MLLMPSSCVQSHAIQWRVEAVRQQKPNIVLITTDTQRWDTLRCMGNEKAISPNLDRLAAQGVLFTQAHTSSPVCMPARCSLLTGTHTPVHGCLENGINRHEHLPVFPDHLKEAGYFNIMVGKTHFGPIPTSFDVVDIEDKAQHLPYAIDKSMGYIDEVSGENAKPFFLFCSLVAPHSPLLAPDEWEDAYKPEDLPAINFREGEIDEHPSQLRKLVGTHMHETELEETLSYGDQYELGYLYEAQGVRIENHDRDDIDRLRCLYYGYAAYCDHEIGRLIDYLDRSGLREKTLVIFSSDHGAQYFDHGFNDKHTFYDSSWRVPLIMSMPGTLPERETREFAIWNDIATTILGCAGIVCKSMQGFDLFSALRDGLASPRKCAVATLYKSAAVKSGQWKLEFFFPERVGRLFNVVADPLEQNDLYYQEPYRQVRDEILQALLTWRSDLCDVHYLYANTRGGGPVAERVRADVGSLTGVDNEHHLGVVMAEIDERFCC